VKRRYYWTEDRHIGRLQEAGGQYEKAEVLRDGKWQETTPAELIWNANLITRKEAIVNLVKYVRDPVTEEEALRLID